MVLETCPLTEDINKIKRKEIVSKFSILNSCQYHYYLSLWKFLHHKPEKFYWDKASNCIFNFLGDLLQNESKMLIDIFNIFNRQFFITFKNLQEINQLEFHDKELSNNEYELMQFCDNHISPNYLKLVEGVFSNLIIPFSIYLRIKRKASIEGLDTFNSVQELQNSKYKYLSNYYNSTIRNAIAHGKVEYQQWNVSFEDKKGNTFSLSLREFINYFDNLLDICNGLSLGYKLFYFTNMKYFEKNNIKVPISIFIEELKDDIKAPGYEVRGCLESRTIDNRSQLIIYTYNNLYDGSKIRYHTLRTALVSEKLLPGYDRYFISIDSKHHIKSFAAFNGKELKRLRIQNSKKILNYATSIEKGSFLFLPRFKVPKLISILINSAILLKTTYPIKFREAEYFKPKLSIDIRDLEMHRNKFHLVVNGRIVITTTLKISIDELIRKYCNYIIKKVTRSARKKTKVTDISKYLPLGFIRISLYEKDFRIRTLRSAGIIPELIGTLELKTLKRIKAPDIMGGIPETVKNIKIVWNSKAKSLRII